MFISLEIFMLGIAAMMLLSGVPQLMRILKRKSSSDISLAALVIIIFGNLCWTWYGITIDSPPVIMQHGISSAVMILAVPYILKYHDFS